MIPHRQIILAYRSVAAAALRHVARLRKGERVQVVCLPGGDEDFIFDNLHVAYQCYEAVAERLDSLPIGELRETVVLIGSPLRIAPSCGGEAGNNYASLNRGWDPLQAYGTGRDRRFQPTLETVVAWLVLTYPEVKWLWWAPGLQRSKFSEVEEQGALWKRALIEWHGCSVGCLEVLEGRHADHRIASINGLVRFFPTLFDPSGLRASIRALMGTVGGANTGKFQVCRTKVVLAVDEERDYSQLAGYAAYRSGHRAWVASTWNSFEHLWAWRGVPVPEVTASFEDLYLAFADQAEALPEKSGFLGTEGLSNLRYRDKPIDGTDNLFAKSLHRVLVTVGHKRGKNGEGVWNDNLSYLKSRAGTHRVVRKPLGSVHLLLKEAGFQAKARAATGWIVSVRKLQQVEEARHSAPGRILACAERLIQRSRRILRDCGDPEDALHAAVLALEAKELLSGQTPTMTLEAIALQHEAEVTAESLFLGVEYNKDLNDRFDELRREVEAVSFWFGSRRRARSALNARLTIAERMAQKFRGLNQIEEELRCLSEARNLRFAFWVREKPWRWVLWPVLRYLSFSLQSIPRFIGVVIGCGLFFGLSYYVLGSLAGRSDLGFWDALASSWKFSVTAESVDRWTYLVKEGGYGGCETFWNLWLSFQGAVSLTNFGLLFSHLYLVISRR